LTDREDVHLDAGKVAKDFDQLVGGLADADHHSGL